MMRRPGAGASLAKALVSAAMLAAFAGGAGAAELVDRMVFPAENGNVVYYHNNHVNEVKGDCTICHEKAPGRIAGFGKDFAHKLCIGCHVPRDGYPEGPTTCDGCHMIQPDRH